MRNRFLFSLPLLFSVVPAAQAAEDIETVVVTATRTPQPVERTGESVSVITSQDLQLQQSVAVYDALALTPSSIVVRNGGMGQNATVSLRGAEVGQSLVLVDGVRINDPSSTDDEALLGDVLANNIDRIEVLRGPQSTLYGSQAIGGVVNIITRTGGDSPFATQLSAEGGSFDTYHMNAGVHGTYDVIDYGAAVNYFSPGGISAVASGSGDTETDGYRNVGATGNVRVHVLDNVSVDLRCYYTVARSDIAGFPPPDYTLADDPEFTKNDLAAGYAGINVDLFGGIFHSRLALVGSRADRRFFGIFDANPPYTFTPTQNFYGLGGSARIEYQGIVDVDDANQLTFGAESQRNTFNSESLYDLAPTLGARRTTSGYAQWQTTLFEQLTLTSGVRFDGDSEFGGHTSLKFAGAWNVPDTDTVLRANYGDGFKAPSLYELYSQYSNPTTKLAPETARGWEAGVDQRFWNDRLRASVTWFSRKTKDQIDFLTPDCLTPPVPNICMTRPFGYYYNIGRSRSEGAEFEVSGQVIENVTASFNLTDMSSEDLTTHTDLPRRPRLTTGGSLFWTPMERTSLGLTLQHVGDRFDSTGDMGYLPGYTLVNILGSYPINENFSLYGRIENAFDARYEPVLGYGAPGRAAYMGIRANF
jgi:vitamin B12 transporter